MKIKEKDLQYSIEAVNCEELQELTTWVFEHKKIIKNFTMFYYPQQLRHSSVNISFDDEEKALAFVLRWT